MDIKIEIKTGSVISQHVDAIVNSANNWLILGSGIAGEIREAGGATIQDECNAIIQKNGGKPLQIGDAILTHSGNLLSEDGYRRYIIHAIGMGYVHTVGDPENRILATAETIASAVRNALMIAKVHMFRSVAFPLMCARPGYSIYSPEEAPLISLKTMITEINEFLRQNEFPQHIILIVQNDAQVAYGNELVRKDDY